MKILVLSLLLVAGIFYVYTFHPPAEEAAAPVTTYKTVTNEGPLTEDARQMLRQFITTAKADIARFSKAGFVGGETEKLMQNVNEWERRLGEQPTVFTVVDTPAAASSANANRTVYDNYSRQSTTPAVNPNGQQGSTIVSTPMGPASLK